MLAKHPRMKLDADLAQEIIIFNLPSENFEKTFDTFTHWARFGNLFAYDEDTKKIFYPRKRQYKPRVKPDSKADSSAVAVPGEISPTENLQNAEPAPVSEPAKPENSIPPETPNSKA